MHHTEEHKIQDLDVCLGIALGLILALTYFICANVAYSRGYNSGVEFTKAKYQVVEFDESETPEAK